jgi:DNA-binding response OmpR family regulator
MAEAAAEEERPLVLVVDDDPTTRILVRGALEPAGYAVEEAEGGAEAVSSFERSRPDIVLLDVNMPGMDGFAVCAALRARQDGRQVPVMMVTGLDDHDSIHRAYEIGATDFVTKPINLAQLGHRVRYLLRGSRLQQELR